MEFAAAVATVVSTLYPVINKLGSKLGGDVTAEEMSYLNVFVRYKITAVIRIIRTAELDHSGRLMPLLDKLQAAVFEAEDLLDLYEYKQIEKQVSSSSNPVKKLVPKFKEKLSSILPKSSLRISFENLLKFANQVEEIYPSIKSITHSTQQNYESTQASSSIPTTSTLLSPYFGRAKQIGNIIRFLLDESLAHSNTRTKRVPIISIRGIAGSGKSLTAQRIFNDVPVNAFHLKMWVHTRNFNVCRLTKEIIESATKGKCDEIANLDTLQTNLKKCISHQKFLLVLDDVWYANGAQWDLLLGPLNEVGVNGSKIIITTRMEQITSTLRAKEFPLEELEPEDSWSILKHYAFDNSEEIIEDQDLQNVGNQIITKVKSSPLALKIAGSSLREQRNINEWKNILKQDLLKETMDLLLFSFHHLPSHLQRCFAYCSLFPKGYQFTIFPYYHERQHLIPLWIAQGYVEKDTSKLTLEEIGKTYIEKLISYSFFEKRSEDYFVIHDLLHDLAEKVSKGRCHRIENHGSLNIPTTCIHLSICEEELEELDREDIDISKSNNLRTLIIFDPYVFNYIFINKKNIFLKLIKLRALHIQHCFKMDVLSDPHFDKLKHLRYLRVSFVKKLSKSLTKLYHLQFCNLMGMTFHIEKDSVNGMKSLKNLPLCGSLSIASLENIKSKKKAAKAMLNRKKNLNGLTLEWNNSPGIVDNSSTCEEVLDALEPPPSLETLRIVDYQGVKVANWMIIENWLPRLQTLYLGSCDEVESLPNMPMSLKELWIINCAKLTTLPMNLEKLTSLAKLKILDCDDVESLPSMPMSLKELWIINCTKLTTLPMNLEKLTSLEKLGIEDCHDVESLPNMPMFLKELWIINCAKLTTLPMNLEKLTSLENLRINGCHDVESLPDMPMSLNYLTIINCAKLTTLPMNLEKLTSLENLLINGCHDVESLPNMPMSLKELWIINCAKLTTLPMNLEKLTSLGGLMIEDCDEVESLPNMPMSLNELGITNCAKLTTLPMNLEKLTSLEKLKIVDCDEVESLPNMPMSLEYLEIVGCHYTINAVL